jgi:anti-anti-sigma factor
MREDGMLTKIFPFLVWFRDYDREKFKIDFIAGLTVALVLIPQSMAYAQLAGMPAYYGLYAAFLPPMVAALFGSSRQLQTGPVAVVSLMTAASLEPLATAGSEAFIAYAILLSLTVGVFQFLLGVLRLGLVVNFLSHPVVNGFTNAAAIIIASSQFSKLFGVYVDKAEHHYETILWVIRAAMHYTHWPTLAMGLFAIAIMVILKRVNPRIPNVLVAVVVTTLLSWGLGFQKDTSVPLESIRVEEMREEVLAFNGVTEKIRELGEKRTLLNRQLKELEENKADAVALLEQHHKLTLLARDMDEAMEKQHEIRENLRLYLLKAVPDNEGGRVFYEKSRIPPELRPEKGVWRLKVGNRLLSESSLYLMGAGAVVGEVPKGLPAFGIPKVSMAALMQLLPYAVIISLLGFMEAISIAKAMAAKTGQKLDPNQELIGQGLANMVGAIGQSYPASGSFSRSAVNLQAGAVTGLSSVVTSCVVVLTLLFFTPLLYHLPQAVLAAVIMMAVIGLINVSGFIHAWKAQPSDGIISIISFACTLIFAPHLDKGIMVGVVLSLLVFLFRTMRPTVASLSMDDTMTLRCARIYELQECPHVAVIRFDGTLFFANASYLEDQVLAIQNAKPQLKHMLVVCDGINDMDASGEETLALLIERVRARGQDISFCGVKEKVMAVFKRTHLLEKIGEEHIYGNAQDAVEDIFRKTHKDGSVYTCPLVNYVPEPHAHLR